MKFPQNYWHPIFLLLLYNMLLVVDCEVYSKIVSATNATTQQNKIRAGYNSPPVSFDSTLSENAKKCASTMAEWHLPIAAHPCQESGESIYQTSLDLSEPIISDSDLMKEAVNAWYEEKSYMKTIGYNVFDEKWLKVMSNDDFQRTGHFMQMIWKSVKLVGCAVSYYTTETTRVYYVLCRYSPAPYLKTTSERLANLPITIPSLCADSSSICEKVATVNNCKSFEGTRTKCRKSCNAC